MRGLRQREHDATHVANIGLLAAGDRAIADDATTDGLVLTSKDEDFVTLHLPDRFALLSLRCGNASNHSLSVWLDARWERIETLMVAG